ncbi:hypothetical protein FB451DRAFT_1400905 [Mycena latifolia]|nr:hypothetical protein FB451DRAFT_1400905 [Mycena latifolia]
MKGLPVPIEDKVGHQARMGDSQADIVSFRHKMPMQQPNYGFKDVGERVQYLLTSTPFSGNEDGVIYTHLQLNKHKAEHLLERLMLQHADFLMASTMDGDLVVVNMKVGRAKCIDKWQTAYHYACKGETLAWVFAYKTKNDKLVEALVHTRLELIGACTVPYPCHGCKHRHTEHFCAERIRWIEGCVNVVEECIRLRGGVSQPIRMIVEEKTWPMRRKATRELVMSDVRIGTGHAFVHANTNGTLAPALRTDHARECVEVSTTQ